ncbi:hypothetical protein MKK84_19430 [Methylobacterium sp. E-065]|uniref:hypothetical protein n=1 Tax=Methylobacterium sp. E-065 TaxID=2836583 RepID=UPI001FBB895F|nr:hypothetical protein [Methylobacterium sp. E-065]MCJ2019578.1 hypothetical protein [Methylobacterium sp. E-065]
MSLRLQPIQVATGDADQESQLVFHDGFLVAVLVRLSHEYEDEAGKWYLEVGFGRVNTATPPTFTDLGEAQGWIEQRLTRAA